MAASCYEDLIQHVGHKIVCVSYGKRDPSEAVNVAVECETCHEVITDFDRDDLTSLPATAGRGQRQQ